MRRMEVFVGTGGIDRWAPGGDGRMKIRWKRAHEPPAKDDGVRLLVERLWPRGLTKERAR